MNIAPLNDNVPKAARQGISQIGTAVSFKDALSQANNAAASANSARASSAAAPSAEAAKAKKAAAARADYQALATELHDYLRKTPAQHMGDAILKEMGLTEDDQKNLRPEEHEAKAAEIARRMKERLLGKDDGSANPAALPGAAASASAAMTGTAGATGKTPVSPSVIAALQAQTVQSQP